MRSVFSCFTWDIIGHEERLVVDRLQVSPASVGRRNMQLYSKFIAGMLMAITVGFGSIPAIANAEILYQEANGLGQECTWTGGYDLVAQRQVVENGSMSNTTNLQFYVTAIGGGNTIDFNISTTSSPSAFSLDSGSVTVAAGQRYKITLFGPTTQLSQSDTLYIRALANPASGICISANQANNAVTGLFFNEPLVTHTAVTTVTSPTDGSVVEEGFVPISFAYTVLNGDTGAVGYHLVNVTDGVNMQGGTTTYSGAGAFQFSTSTILASGKQYAVTAFVTVNGVESGQTVNFSVGTSSPNDTPRITSYNSQFGGFVPRFIPLVVATSSSSTPSYVDWTNATTAANGIIYSISGSTTAQLLAGKWPFSYIYDMALLLKQLGTGHGQHSDSGSNDAYYTLPTGPLGSHLANGSTTIKIIDTTAIGGMSVVLAARNLLTNILYFTTGVAVVGQVMSIL